jgi:hypothetical protein
MKRLAVLVVLLLIVCSCVKEEPEIGIENFDITIQINRNGTFAYKYDGVLVLDAGWFRPSTEEFVRKEEERASKDTAYKEFKYVGKNRFRVVFEATGPIEKRFESNLVSLEQSPPGKVLLKRNINTSAQYKDWCQKYVVQFSGTLTVKTDAEVISQNAQAPPWFAFWKSNTFVWKITSLDDPAPSMELQLEVGAAPLKAELANRFEKGREGYLTRLFDATGQVQVTWPDGRTQLLPYCSHLQPAVAPDGRICIFTSENQSLTGMVAYDSARGFGESFPLPEDLRRHPETSQPSFSPDGAKVAYYFGGKTEGQLEIRAGLMDLTGKEVVFPVLEDFTNKRFVEGLAPVKLKGKWGYLDITGEMVIPPRFDTAMDFSEGLGGVKMGEKWGFINRAGKMIIKPQFSEVHKFSEGLALVKLKKEKLGHGGSDQTGKMAIPPQPGIADNGSQKAMTQVSIDHRAGFIDKSGKMVIPPQAGIVGDFHEGLARVYLDKKAGFIDRFGKMVISPQFDNAFDFQEGLAKIYTGQKFGFIDKEGNMVIPPQFGSYTQDFVDGVAWVWIIGPTAGWGIIDRTGNLIVPKEELSSLPKEHPKAFSEGLALAASVTGKWGFLDKTGWFVIPPRYRQAENFSEGLAAVNVGGTWGSGKWDVGKWGFIDRAGSMVIPAHYDSAGSFSAGRAPVCMDGKYGAIDRTGKMILLPQHHYVESLGKGVFLWVDFSVPKGSSGKKMELPGVRVCSWPDWRILWQSPPLMPKWFSEKKPRPPHWEGNFLVEFDPEFFRPPQFLQVQLPEPGGKDAQQPAHK